MMKMPTVGDFPVFTDMSLIATRLYLYLKYYEDKLARDGSGEFSCTSEQITKISKLSKSSIIRARKELADKGVIETWQTHYVNPATNKKSEKHISAYRILL